MFILLFFDCIDKLSDVGRCQVSADPQNQNYWQKKNWIEKNRDIPNLYYHDYRHWLEPASNPDHFIICLFVCVK